MTALPGVEERDHRENAALIVLRRRQPQLRKDAVHVFLDRALGDPELTGDAGVRATLGHEREHLALARREHVERIFGSAGGKQLLNERGIDDRSSVNDPFERLDELVHIGDAALQQVAAALAAGEQVRRLLDLDVSGENEDRGLRDLLADHAGGIETLGRVAGGHPDVDDRELRSMLANERHEHGGVGALAHDVEAGALEQTRQAFAQEDVVVRQDDACAAFAHTVDYAGR